MCNCARGSCGVGHCTEAARSKERLVWAPWKHFAFFLLGILVENITVRVKERKNELLIEAFLQMTEPRENIRVPR